MYTCFLSYIPHCFLKCGVGSGSSGCQEQLKRACSVTVCWIHQTMIRQYNEGRFVLMISQISKDPAAGLEQMNRSSWKTGKSS